MNSLRINLCSVIWCQYINIKRCMHLIIVLLLWNTTENQSKPCTHWEGRLQSTLEWPSSLNAWSSNIWQMRRGCVTQNNFWWIFIMVLGSCLDMIISSEQFTSFNVYLIRTILWFPLQKLRSFDARGIPSCTDLDWHEGE